MANKFQKSVRERLENNTVPPKELPSQSPKKTPSSDTVKPKEVSRELTADDSVLSYLKQENIRDAKNKTFYLDTKVIEAIKTAAKSHKTTDSKLVNDILSNVLNVK